MLHPAHSLPPNLEDCAPAGDEQNDYCRGAAAISEEMPDSRKPQSRKKNSHRSAAQTRAPRTQPRLSSPKPGEMEISPERDVRHGEHRCLPTFQNEQTVAPAEEVSMAGVQAVNTVCDGNQSHSDSANPHFLPTARRLRSLKCRRVLRRLITILLDIPSQLVGRRGDPRETAIPARHRLAGEPGTAQRERKRLTTGRREHGGYHSRPVVRYELPLGNPVPVTTQALLHLNGLSLSTVFLNEGSQFLGGKSTPNQAALQTGESFRRGEPGPRILRDRK